MRFPHRTEPRTLRPLKEEWSEDEKMEGGRASELTVWVFSEAAGGCKMQKQRRTSRLKKKEACMNAPEKACVVSLACLIPVTPSQPCLSGHYCLVYFCSLLSFLRIKQLTANIRTSGGLWWGLLRRWTWHYPRNAYAVIGSDKSCTLGSPQSVLAGLAGI